MSMAASRHRSDMASNIVIMGVAGCGKTTVGERLSEVMGIPFRDGDTLHPQANIKKMASGVPLSDNDRRPWLQAIGQAFASSGTPLIIGCSALRRAYRDVIREMARGGVTFIHLTGSRDIIAERMAKRRRHFMPLTLLDSQFATLEPPGIDEDPIVIDIDQPPDAIVRIAASQLGKTSE